MTVAHRRGAEAGAWTRSWPARWAPPSGRKLPSRPLRGTTVRLRAPGAPAAAAKAAAVPTVAARPSPGGRGVETPPATCVLRLHRAHLLGPASPPALAGPGRRIVHGLAARQHLAGRRRTKLAATLHAGCERLATRLRSAGGGGGLQHRRDLPDEAGHPQLGGLAAPVLQQRLGSLPVVATAPLEQGEPIAVSRVG